MPTYIDGVASSQALDTAGEIVDLNGLDCSSLMGAPLNWEHKSDLPAQIVGKILEYKKIFSEQDCENDRQKMFWDKCQVPFLYCLGRLFDDKKDSAREVAALFMDDAENPNEPKMVGFSIEGNKLQKKGMTITHSIARKLTITACPANKTCVAEMVPAQGSNKKDGLDSIFKTESGFEVMLFKSESLGQKLKKSSKLLKSWTSDKANPKGMHFNHPEHGTVSITKPAEGQFEVKHNGKLAGMKGVKGTFSSAGDAGKHAKTYMRSVTNGTVGGQHLQNRPSPEMVGKSEIKKALTAGSGMAAPNRLVEGAALAKESLVRKKWLGKAQAAYSKWEKREEFEQYMGKKMPHLTKGEITAIGQTIALSKSLKKDLTANNSVHSYLEKEEVKKFDDAVMDGPMAASEKKPSLKKDSDIMMASEKKK